MDPSLRAAKIRILNDQLRQRRVGGEIVFVGDLALENTPELKDAILDALAAYDAFDEGDDPYQEHDFGSIEVNGEKMFWKIDYFGVDRLHLTEDATDPAKTVRLLQVMYARDY